MAQTRAAREAASKRRGELREAAEVRIGRKLADGECWCGCGELPATAPTTVAWRGVIAGEPHMFVHGHASRRRELVTGPEYRVDENGCWIWQRALNSNGYGNLAINGKYVKAHRVYYERANGPIPEGLEVHHLCAIRACVNPAHLEPLTRAEHMRQDGRTPSPTQAHQTFLTSTR